MYKIECPKCGAVRDLTYIPGDGTLCKSCSKKLLVQTVGFKYPTKYCAFCGGSFVPASSSQRYCKREHWRTCPVCGSQYLEDNVENLKRPPIACSYQCRAKATRATSIEKYGCNAPGNNPSARAKARDTCMKRFGVPYAMQSQEVKTKATRTLLDKFGLPNLAESDNILEIYKAANAYRSTISECNLNIISTLLQRGLCCELEKPIENRSYDIALETIKTVVEIDPSYTHNLYGNHWGPGISKYYHRDKTELAMLHGYRCIHVFDWDDKTKIINMLLPKQKVYARKCKIFKLKKEVARDFLNEHHLQGSVNGQLLCLGLVYDNTLMQVMTFGRPRYDKKYTAELLRLCTKSGYLVIGGAEKLFKFATDYYCIDSVISYCDLSKFTGDVYQRLGMKLIRKTPPQIVWSRGRDKITSNLLRARGYHQLFGTSYGKGTSNEQLMLDNGWLPVCDCGQAVFEYLKQ